MISENGVARKAAAMTHPLMRDGGYGSLEMVLASIIIMTVKLF